MRGALEWVLVILIALAATFLIRTFVVEPFVVPTGSMEDTIEIGDQILAQKVSLELGQPVKQGDIVVFHNPDGTSEHDVLVKRVIATAGQTVDLQDGKVVVDGQALDEDYTAGMSWPRALPFPAPTFRNSAARSARWPPSITPTTCRGRFWMWTAPFPRSC